MEESKTCLCDYIDKYTYSVPQKELPNFNQKKSESKIIPYDDILPSHTTTTHLTSKNNTKPQ